MEWISNDIGKEIDPRQFGSLKGSSTTHYLVKLLDEVYRNTDKPYHSALVVTMDFSKAFDRVDHNIVIGKLIELCVCASLVLWICSFL